MDCTAGIGWVLKQIGDIIDRIVRRQRQRRLVRRLRRASGQSTIESEFRLAAIAVAICLMLTLTAQFVNVLTRNDDRVRLLQARAVEELAQALRADSTQLKAATVDLVNQANAGLVSPERRRQLITAESRIDINFARLVALVPDADPILKSAPYMAQIDDTLNRAMAVDATQPESRREEVKTQVSGFTTRLEAATRAIDDWAKRGRRDAVNRLEHNDRTARIIIVGVTLLAFFVGLSFYLQLSRGVFPVANNLRRVIVAMANGRLEGELPDQHYREPQQMTLALRKLRAAARREQQYARIDFLTDLPNRRALAQALAAWPTDRSGCIMVVDIDGFKLVNDNFGHPVGDELIRNVAARLQDAVPPGSLVARLGGDEFAVVVAMETSGEAAALGGKIVAACAEPMATLGVSLSISVSVGIAPLLSAPGKQLELAEVLRAADLALYAAKADGRNSFAVYTPEMRVSADLLHLIEKDLDGAIAEGGLHLVFQPIVAGDGQENEIEALLRWNHPTLGALSPEKLIDVAERSGQMERLGHWIIVTALGALADWPALTLSLNLSPRQLRAPNFVAMLTAECHQHAIPPRRVILEITESVAVDNGDRAFLTLNLLQTMGFRIALDDFGKGYSSLWMLKQFAFDRLKMDRSLVEDIERSAQARAILQAAVTMGRQLDMEVVAEGVDNPGLAHELAALGCTHLQGYWFSRPLEQSDVAA